LIFYLKKLYQKDMELSEKTIKKFQEMHKKEPKTNYFGLTFISIYNTLHLFLLVK
jgi:hypothetical protein